MRRQALRRSVAGLLAALLGVSCLVACSTPPAAHAPVPTVDPELFGMHVEHLATTPETPWPAAPVGSLRIWDAGATWARLEPAPGQWDWTVLDREVALAHEHRASVLLVLGETPTWASARPATPGPYGLGSAAEPRSLSLWRDYVHTVATRYKGLIQAYEVWNEPIEAKYYTGSVATMVGLAREADLAVKAVDPAAAVVSPAPYYSRVGLDFLDQFFRAGGGRWVDVVGLHLYAHSPEDMLGELGQFRAILGRDGVGDKPVWNTETGWHSPGPWTAATARGVVARSYLLLAGAGVSRFYWYAWDNWSWVGIRLTLPDGRTLTPAGAAYRDTYRLLVGSRVSGCGPAPGFPLGVWSCAVQHQGYLGKVTWSPARYVVARMPARSHGYLTLAGVFHPAPAGALVLLGPEPIELV